MPETLKLERKPNPNIWMIMRVVVNLMNVKQCTMSFIIVIMFLLPKYPLHTLQLYQAQSPNNGIMP